MRKKWRWIFALLAVLVLLAAGCSSRDGSGAGSEASTQAAAGEIGEDSNASAEQAPEGNGTGGTASGEAGSGILQAADPNRKLVKTQTAEMETTEFDAFTAWVQENIRKAGGYIENASVSGKETGGTAFRHANYVLRIPETGLDTFMEELKTEGNVLYYTESVEDITLNYTDTESHIAALEQEQGALMDMLSQSGDLDTLLAIQSRLTEVRYQLENYESQLRIYDNEIDYSTLYLEVSEVERETAQGQGEFGNQLSERISNNFYALGKGIQNFALWFLGGMPFWIPIGGIILVICILYRRKRRKTEKKTKESGVPEPPGE